MRLSESQREIIRQGNRYATAVAACGMVAQFGLMLGLMWWL